MAPSSLAITLRLSLSPSLCRLDRKNVFLPPFSGQQQHRAAEDSFRRKVGISAKERRRRERWPRPAMCCWVGTRNIIDNRHSVQAIY